MEGPGLLIRRLDVAASGGERAKLDRINGIGCRVEFVARSRARSKRPAVSACRETPLPVCCRRLLRARLLLLGQPGAAGELSAVGSIGRVKPRTPFEDSGRTAQQRPLLRAN